MYMVCLISCNKALVYSSQSVIVIVLIHGDGKCTFFDSQSCLCIAQSSLRILLKFEIMTLDCI